MAETWTWVDADGNSFSRTSDAFEVDPGAKLDPREGPAGLKPTEIEIDREVVAMIGAIATGEPGSLLNVYHDVVDALSGEELREVLQSIIFAACAKAGRLVTELEERTGMTRAAVMDLIAEE